MLKFLLFSFSFILFVNAAYCKSRSGDTLAVLYAKDGHSVRSIDSAEWFMLIMPPDAGDNRNNVKGFYKDGKVKFVAKDSPNNNSIYTGSVLFDGDYISYYKNGKRDCIMHYNSGYKDGFEFRYYPDGTEYCCLKHQTRGQLHYYELFNWECFDAKGKEICKEGNGHWITYADSAKTIGYEGEVINGHMEGEWHGITFIPDTIKYIYRYKKSEVLSSIGYDKHGVPHPFKEIREVANYRSGQVTFVELLRNRIKLPKNNNGEKMSLDTLHASFVVEKDGHIDQFDMSSNAPAELRNAVFAALGKFNGWSPEKFYGVPFRTKITFPIREISGYSRLGSYKREAEYSVYLLKDN